MKLFVALDVTPEFRAALEQIQAELRKRYPHEHEEARPVLPGDLHLTLRYIGHAANTTPVVERLKAVRFNSFRLCTESIGTFSSEPYPVAWAGVGGELAALNALKQKVDRALLGLHCADPAYGFVPHITLAYLKRPLECIQDIPVPHVEMLVKQVSLYVIKPKQSEPLFEKVYSFSASDMGENV